MISKLKALLLLRCLKACLKSVSADDVLKEEAVKVELRMTSHKQYCVKFVSILKSHAWLYFKNGLDLI